MGEKCRSTSMYRSLPCAVLVVVVVSRILHARRKYLVQSLLPLSGSTCIKNIVPCRKESTLHCEAYSHELFHHSGRISPTRSGTLMGTANRSMGYGKSLSTCVYPLCLERVFSRCLQVPSPVARGRLGLPAEMPDPTHD